MEGGRGRAQPDVDAVELRAHAEGNEDVGPLVRRVESGQPGPHGPAPPGHVLPRVVIDGDVVVGVASASGGQFASPASLRSVGTLRFVLVTDTLGNGVAREVMLVVWPEGHRAVPLAVRHFLQESRLVVEGEENPEARLRSSAVPLAADEVHVQDLGVDQGRTVVGAAQSEESV